MTMTDSGSTRICADCGVSDPALFSDAYYCRRCKTIRTRIWNRRNSLAKYGITRTEWAAMFAAQDGACAICTEPLGDRPHVDHDHATGDVRGLLCPHCNWMLGNAKDSPANLRRAALYLERSAKPAGRRERE